MKHNNICPCCNNYMLHHLEGNRSYWFCRDCWLEINDRPSVPKRKSAISLNSLRLFKQEKLVQS